MSSTSYSLKRLPTEHGPTIDVMRIDSTQYQRFAVLAAVGTTALVERAYLDGIKATFDRTTS
jgi:hypothetical protein